MIRRKCDWIVAKSIILGILLFFVTENRRYVVESRIFSYPSSSSPSSDEKQHRTIRVISTRKQTGIDCTSSSPSPPATLKVYILAGQSNMEGHGEIDTKSDESGKLLNGTLLYQVHDPRTRPTFKHLWDDESQDWVVRSDVKVWFNEASQTHADGHNGSTIPGVNFIDYSAGDLTVGFGAGGLPTSPFFGPELGFGWNLDLQCNEKVLLVKTAWGGKTLAGDFRPPSSTRIGERKRGGYGKDEDDVIDPYCQLPDCDPTIVGHFYQVMLDDLQKLLKPGVIGTIYPDLDGLTPKISGFGWFQGWNDGCNVNDTAAYETNMVNLIKDLRKEFNDPYLPVSIAVSGFGGSDTSEENRTPASCWKDDRGRSISSKVECESCGRDHHDHQCRRIDIILSQMAASDLSRHPELVCCVKAVETRNFWREPEYSPNHRQDYHFYHNAETHYLIGKAMGIGMNKATRERPDLTTYSTINSAGERFLREVQN